MKDYNLGFLWKITLNPLNKSARKVVTNLNSFRNMLELFQRFDKNVSKKFVKNK